MGLKKLVGGFDYVQSDPPTNPRAGESWFDQSADEGVRTKLYADVGSGLEWVAIPSLAQDDILSDGHPFPGANVDASVSSRSSHDDPDPQGHLDADVSTRAVPDDSPDPSEWTATRAQRLDKAISALNDLAESDILSDGQAFPGGNVDAAVSSRAVPEDSVDWSSKTPLVADSSATISGSGFALGLSVSGTTTDAAGYLDCGLTIDGSYAQYFRDDIPANTHSSSSASFCVRFDGELDPYVGASNMSTHKYSLFYVLD
ncbi:hypothetical protein J2752_000473 [Halarchaeum rubridurum]|uniref:Uncharacterized protein n=1 Tax=Halarchaeum rubridurum TaxID=489911 RepID=A0A830FY00_9EURY|nr:hypothetical protein [Halarchaeum rubridurum]MBP1953592.1 hypothetical protein [Halarchaeum rubridurum]GGM64122.1 hypothetical protein GCM10009017_12710 [Halarchaeum rubridurum]